VPLIVEFDELLFVLVSASSTATASRTETGDACALPLSRCGIMTRVSLIPAPAPRLRNGDDDDVL
jgi:hypothetical protein